MRVSLIFGIVLFVILNSAQAFEGIYTVLDTEKRQHLAFAIVETKRSAEKKDGDGNKYTVIEYEGLWVEGGSGGGGWPVKGFPWEADKCKGEMSSLEKSLTCEFIRPVGSRDIPKLHLYMWPDTVTECKEIKDKLKASACPTGVSCICYKIENPASESSGSGTGGSGGD